MSNKVIIIGCGYVGRAVTHVWMQQGFDVTATTTSRERISELQAIAHKGILLRADNLDALYDAIVEQNTVLLSIGAPNRDAYEQTYLNTANALAKVLPNTSVKQVIYTGSCAVYGDKAGQWVNEETAIAPITQQHKILAETEQILLRTASNQTNVCILRLGGIYGPGRELVRIFGRAAGQTRPGDGSEPSNWTHLDDIVGAIAFSQTHQMGGLFNLVQDNPPTRRELIDHVCKTHYLRAVQWNPALASTRSYNAKISNQKIKGVGYTLIHSTFTKDI